MLQTNLSTRPFYNVRAVRALLALAAVVVLGVTAFNVVQWVRLSRAQNTLGAHAVEAERDAARLRAEAAGIRSRINAKELDAVSSAAREADGIIGQRTFSWTQLFAQFERTLPPDVRITSVQPKLEQNGAFTVAVGVEARRVEDLDAFIEALEGTKTFRNVLAVEEQTNDKNLLEATVRGTYTAADTAAAPARASR